jgi:DNA-binding transcriptional MerR regulator
MTLGSQQEIAYRSGELAKLTGVSTDTLRHYERKGVLPPPARADNGYRVYPAEALPRVRLIRRALAIGFTLEELGPILSMRDHGRAPCRSVRALAAAKLEALEEQIRDLTLLRDELEEALHAWDVRLAATPEGAPAGLLEGLGRQLAGSNSRARAALRRRKAPQAGPEKKAER